VKRKHIPLRRCVVCGTQASKGNLIRIVRTPNGAVQADPSGKLAGRGAYLCTTPECWQQAFKKTRLDRALRSTVDRESRQALMEHLEALVTTASRAKGEA
jgi:predicted RNA-binding protein YlxR (DUF448 family)